MGRAGLIFVAVSLCLWSQRAYAQPEDFEGYVATTKPYGLFMPKRGMPPIAPLPKQSKLVPLGDLQLTGPRPSHPFVLGNFSADASWGLTNGVVGVLDGKNGALQLAWANQFELTGVIEQTGLGGCFWLLGWDNGHGYALHNVVMKDSGSPWFLTEFRGNRAIEDRTLELDKYEWKGDQTFTMTVENGELSLMVGRFHVLHHVPMESYQPGRIALGVYDTRYGPRSVKIKALRIRELETEAVTESEAGRK